MANVMIDIAAEFVGKPAFKQADTATDKLTKNVKKLAGAFGVAFSATAVLAYGKAAVRAAAEDEKAQKQLALALKNVGLGRDAASSEDYIQRLQSEFGIVDDLLRPAYQSLAIAVRDSNEAQRLLNLSLDISAATGKDLNSVTAALSRAYLGNNTALSRLGVGVSKADLASKSFYEVTTELASTFAGSATQAANTFQGSIDKLGVAAANSQEIIGVGLIDALKALSGDNSVDTLADDMERAALASADFIRGLGQIGSFKVSGDNKSLIGLLTTPFKRSLSAGPLGAIMRLGQQSRINATDSGSNDQAMAHLAELTSKYTSKTLSDSKKITTEERKQLSAKRSKLAIDKAALALSKGEEIFDMEKIQNEAALKSQAEALGKATTSQQVLQIANDTARLNVKKSILALEDAMAAKDEASIVAATNKLNADLRVLGTLGMQNIKLLDIKSILQTLKPLDLINTTNLEEALMLLGKINLAQTGSTKAPTTATSGATAATATPFRESPYSAPYVEKLLSSVDLNSVYGASFAQGIGAGLSRGEAASGARYAAQYASQYNITVQAGIGDPNAIAEAIDQVLTEAVQRGTLTGLAIR
jgi:hypothetical protein